MQVSRLSAYWIRLDEGVSRDLLFKLRSRQFSNTVELGTNELRSWGSQNFWDSSCESEYAPSIPLMLR